MIKEKHITITLTTEEQNILLKSAEFIDELIDTMGSVIYDAYNIDLEEVKDALKCIAYERTFEINENSED